MKKKFYFFDSDALKNFHKRIFFSITIICFIYLIAFYRLIDVTLLENSISQNLQKRDIIERGKIYDRNENLLSSTIYSSGLSVKPKNIRNKENLSKILSPIINIPEEEILKKFSKNNFLIKDVIEKPNIRSAPSNYAVIGRYILPVKIFKALKKQKPGQNGEIHITDAIRTLIHQDNKFIGHVFAGKYLDCGTMRGYVNSSLKISKL